MNDSHPYRGIAGSAALMGAGYATALQQISFLRQKGELERAINLAVEAAQTHLDSANIAKISCDLCFEADRLEDAARWLFEMLLRMWTSPRFRFPEFGKRYQKLSFRLDSKGRNKLRARLRNMLDEGTVNPGFRFEILDLLDSNGVAAIPAPPSRELVRSSQGRTNLTVKKGAEDKSHFPTSGDASSFVEGMLKGTATPGRLFYLAKELGSNSPEALERAIDEVPCPVLHLEKHHHLFDFLLAFLERREKLESAARLLTDHPRLQVPSAISASYLRVCRKTRHIEEIRGFLANNPSIEKTDVFAVLYELVYYYEAQNDLHKVREILSRIEKIYQTQQPILATLRNFYLRYGLFSDASRIDASLAQIRQRRGLKVKPQYKAAAQESSAEVYTDLEHQRQLAALSDLTNGISHELGQPITNIRYTIQLFRRELEQNFDQGVVFRVFDVILKETERMGGLVKRLAPITSSRRVIEDFDVVARIQQRIGAENARISERAIRVELHADGPMAIHADPIRFDQIISNLLVNAIDALSDSEKTSREIKINISPEFGKRVKISFEDNGGGISAEHKRKIFEPFFSTKAPGKGEGLGLFIVWNLLKMQGGTISLDSTYTDGARFVVTLPVELKTFSNTFDL